MNFIETPNLPRAPVSLAVVDGRIHAAAGRKLEEKGIKLLKTEAHPGLSPSVAFHPDMQLHHLGGNTIIYAPGTSLKLLNGLYSFGFSLVEGSLRLTPDYPGDIPYNVARIGQYAFHNYKYTEPAILKGLDAGKITPVNVKQGYSKCSIAVLGENTIITSDKGVAKASKSMGIDTLILDSDPGILLPGLNYGFIGGCSGLIDKSLLFLSGNPSTLGSHEKITAYLSTRGISTVFPEDLPVVDIGSLIPLCTY